MNDLELLKEAVAFCKRIGCRNIVVPAFEKSIDDDAMLKEARSQAAEVFRRAGKFAGTRDVRVLVLNERETLCETARETAALLHEAGGAGLGAAWNPSEALAAGETPDAGWQDVKQVAGLVRVRDYRKRNGMWKDELPGEGSVQWDHVIRLMAHDGYDGALSLEVHAEPKARAGLRSATSLIGFLRASKSETGQTA